LKITVYTKKPCPQCDMTKKVLKRYGLEFEEVDLPSNPDLLEKFKDEGLLQAPIVVIGNDGRRWSGFRPDLLEELKPKDAAA
jgi:glutaredoxin-like protein NrdH